MAWSEQARAAARLARKKRYSLSPSGRLNDPGSFKPATLKGKDVAEARARNAKLMELRNQRSRRLKAAAIKGEKAYWNATSLRGSFKEVNRLARLAKK